MKKLGVVLAMLSVLLMAASAQAVTYTDAININIYGGGYGGYPSTGTPTTSPVNQNPAYYGSSYWNQVTFGGGGNATANSISGGGGWYNATPYPTVKTANLVPVAVGASDFYISNTATGGWWGWNDQSWGDGYGGSTWGLVNAANHGNGGWSSSITLHKVPFASYEVWGYISREENYKDTTKYSWVNLSGVSPITTADYTSTWTSGTYNSLAALQVLEVQQVVPEPAGLGLIGVALLALRKRRS